MFFRAALPLFLLTIRSTRPVDSLSTFHPAGSPVTYHDLSTDVVWACTIPDKGGQNVVEPLPSALHRLWPARFASPTAARKACRRREIFVQNVCLGSCSTLVFPGDVVEQRQRNAPDLPVSSARGIAAAATAALPVLYEDDDIAVVVKPRGMSVHNSPSQSTREGKAGRGVSSPGTLEPEDHITVRSALPHVLAPTRRGASFAPLRRPVHVHRLDKATSGLLVAAKTRAALVSLSASFARRAVHKRYRAIVARKAGDRYYGEVRGAQGTIEAPVEGAPALTRWRVAVITPIEAGQRPHRRLLCSKGEQQRQEEEEEEEEGPLRCLTTLDLFPVTGRRHQLRRHCAPIVGDLRYGGGELLSMSRAEDGGATVDEDEQDEPLFLSSVEISFPHPTTGQVMNFSIPEPPEFEELRRRVQISTGK